MNQLPDPLALEDGELECAPDGLVWRFRGFATLIGVEPRTLLDDCLTGRVPVRVEFYGRRQIPYAVKADALEYRASLMSKGSLQ